MADAKRHASTGLPIGPHGLSTRRLLPGAIQVSGDQNTVLVTVLGSCVAACVRHPVTGVGGMNHFMLPESESGDWQGSSENGRFGNLAMERVIADVLKQGGRKEELEIKLFGGADLYPGSISVGRRNVEFVTNYLCRHGLRMVAQDLGGTLARKIIFAPATGQVLLRKLKPLSDKQLIELELEYAERLKQHKATQRGH